MKFRTALTIVLLTCSGVTYAQQLEDALRIFDEANQLVESGAFEEAIGLYHAVLETGFVSGAVYHNLASAYFRIDEIGESVQYYESARRILGDDPQLMHNIQIVEARVQSPFSKLPTPFWRVWWERLFGQYSAIPFFIAGGSLYLIACLLFGQFLWTKTRNNWHRRARTGTLATGILLLIIAAVISGERNSFQGASILEPTILTTQTERIEVPEGVVVTLVGESTAGTEVRLPNGIQGSVDSNLLGKF